MSIRNAGKHIVGYGVPGKANTLLNYYRCIRTDFIDYMVNFVIPYKQGKYTPGTRISIAPLRSASTETRPNYILVICPGI